jgi:hypothetical protein
MKDEARPLWLILEGLLEWLGFWSRFFVALLRQPTPFFQVPRVRGGFVFLPTTAAKNRASASRDVMRRPPLNNCC